MNKIIILVVVGILLVLVTAIYLYKNNSTSIAPEVTLSYDNSPALLMIDVPLEEGLFNLSKIKKIPSKEYTALNENISFAKESGYELIESFFGDNLYPPGCVSPKYDSKDGISEESYKSCRLETEESGIISRHYFINEQIRIIAEVYGKAKFKNILNCTPIKDSNIIGSMCFQKNEYDYVSLPVFIMTTAKSSQVLVLYGSESYPLSADDVNRYYSFVSSIQIK